VITTVLAFLLTLGRADRHPRVRPLPRGGGLRREGAALLGGLRARPVAPIRQSRRHRVRGLSRCPWAAMCACWTSAKRPVEAGQVGQAFNRQSLARRAAIVAAGPLANLLLAVLLYAGAHWIGVDEPKAVLGSPPRAAWPSGLDCAPVTGCVAGPATARLDGRALGVRSALGGDASCDVARRPASAGHRPRGPWLRTLRLVLADVDPRDVDAQLVRKMGLGALYSEPVLGEVKAGGPAAAGRAAQGRPVLARGWPGHCRCPDAARTHPASVREGRAVPQRWRLERAGQALEVTVTPRWCVKATRPVGRIDAFVGQPPEMVQVRTVRSEGWPRGWYAPGMCRR
jgi:regulator of sigma E protease